MTIANLIIFYLISMIVIASIPAFIELKRWKDAYDKQERIAKFIDEFDKIQNL